MSQEMNVLCCYSCKTFQVHIVKKANKWQCKLCNEKQSFQRIYFQGTGRDCRINVQRLNSLRASEFSEEPVEEGGIGFVNFKIQSRERGPNLSAVCTDVPDSEHFDWTMDKKDTASKWTKYLEPAQEVQRSDTAKSKQDIFHSLYDTNSQTNDSENNSYLIDAGKDRDYHHSRNTYVKNFTFTREVEHCVDKDINNIETRVCKDEFDHNDKNKADCTASRKYDSVTRNMFEDYEDFDDSPIL